MRKIVISLCTAGLLSATSNDPQTILNEVSNLRQKYEECRASQEKGEVKPKVLDDYSKKNQELKRELSHKNGIIDSLEKTLTARDKAFREASAYNKNLISQLHTQKVSEQEREMLKRSLLNTKNELAEVQKVLKQAGGTKVIYKERPITAEKVVEKIVYRDRPVIQEKIVTKTVESNEKITALQRELSSAQATIANLKSSSPKPIVKEKIVEKIVYKDRPVSTQKVVEKVVYKDRIVEKIVYKEKPIEKTKVVEKVVYKDRPVIQEKIVEKVAYKDKPTEKPKNTDKLKPAGKIVTDEEGGVFNPKTKTVLHAQAVSTSSIVQSQKSKLPSKGAEEQKQRQIDKLALERERLSSSHQASIAKTQPSVTPVVPKTVVSASKSSSSNVKRSTPSAYRMATNAGIYNSINGTKIDMWESGRSFTSGTSSNGWVKITGYFVNRVWRAADEELWVKESDVIKR